LNRLTDILLSIFEDQLDLGKLTIMNDATVLLERQLQGLNRAVLRHGGNVKHETAERHVELQYARFDMKRRELRRQQADKELSQLKGVSKGLPKGRKEKDQ